MLLAYFLQRIIKRGQLVVIDATGDNKSIQLKMLINPPLILGEAYMNGDLSVEEGTIYDLLFLISANSQPGKPLPMNSTLRTIQAALIRFQKVTSIKAARRNVAHHYDLDKKLYQYFLDADLQYSCAYFMTEKDTLEEAQYNKLRHVASKLKLEPGQRILDIGSGWGGLALYLARTTGVNVTGITLSKEQQMVSHRRAENSGLSKQVNFNLLDYREVEGKFDRIVSVGMFEHVDIRQYQTFFEKVSDLLKDDGVALIHSISRSSPPVPLNQPWLLKYIFPGAYIPSLSEILEVVEKTDLWVTDIEILRLHYALTLKAWRRRFLLHWREVAEVYDERFCRMWEFYLASCEAFFRNQSNMVVQIQLTKRIDSLPLTRDYMIEWERNQPSHDKSSGFLKMVV